MTVARTIAGALALVFVGPALADEASASMRSAVLVSVDGLGNICTAFRVTKDMATMAGHCVQSDLNMTYDLHLGDGEVVAAKVALFSNYGLGLEDYALLKESVGVDDPAWPDNWTIALLDCSGVALPIGAPVRAEGYPRLEDGLEVVWGRIDGVTRPVGEWRKPVITHDLAIDHGDSGAPLYDDKTNKVIGIIVGVNTDLLSLSRSQPITAVCDALHL